MQQLIKKCVATSLTLSISLFTFTLLAHTKGEAHSTHNTMRTPVVLESYPNKPADFQKDIRPFVDAIISKYGIEEWNTVVLTNELHRHLGIYSILGAKMGIRARELLGAGLDDLHVKSLIGSQPPMSCLNDGLQVSTGASLGRGTIEVASKPTDPAVIFSYHNQKLRIDLKSSVTNRIKKDIIRTKTKYGNLTPEYFQEIRRLAIRYWLDFDRKKIFTEKLL
ncbi:MAG: hypothetical protein HN337_08465 [Deltaproteobacteria bacterium]|jgi:pyrimidine-specific ribonucleoside hydrolase|nr:hypothetical protein [Deltaproteobacteria bacterium]